MQTVREIPTARKAPKAFYATLDNDEVHARQVSARGRWDHPFFADDGAILDYTPEMAPWLTGINGEVSLTGDGPHPRYSAAAARPGLPSHRLQEVAEK